jgi:2-phosphosulfolactate phosphatase
MALVHLQRIQDAPVVLAAAFVNRQAVVEYLIAQQPETVWLVGSGWEGSFSLEDTAVRVRSLITAKQLNYPLDELAGNDELLVRSHLRSVERPVISNVPPCHHGKRLLRLNCQEDLKYCAQTDVLDVYPSSELQAF